MNFADPTLDTLRSLNDASRWVVVPNVPIFCPHERKGKDGKPIKVDAARLERIASRMLANERGGAVPARIIPGHTTPGAPQKDQPDWWGLATGARVGTFGPENRPAILATFYYRRDCWDEARKYPFRSAEFYPGRDEITAISLLKTDPELDLGMLAYERDDGAYFYGVPGAMEGAMDDSAPPEDYDKDPVCQKMLRYMKKCYPHLDKLHEQYALSALGPTNARLPAMADAINKPTEPLQMSRDEQISMYERQLAEVQTVNTDLKRYNSELAAQITELAKETRVVRYERELEQLVQQGYPIKVAAELPECRDLTPEQFARHKAVLVRVGEAGRKPVGAPPIRLGELPDPAPKGVNAPPPRHEEIMQYMRARPGTSYEMAEAHVLTGAGAAAGK